MTYEERLNSAFNIVVRYGFCGECRWGLDSEHCHECDRYNTGVKPIKDALEKQIEAEKKPKRRIDTMTEYELSDLLYRYIEAKSRSCRECPVRGYCYVHPPVGCTRTVVRYLLSPAEEEKK